MATFFHLLMFMGLASASDGALRVITPERILPCQRETIGPDSRYDWGPSVMLDDDGLYKMWWVRLAGAGQDVRFPFEARIPGGGLFSFTYPDWGDRIFYAESRDGITWSLDGEPFRGDPSQYGPNAAGPLLVLTPAESGGEINHVGSPTVLKVDGTYFMYYESCADYQFNIDGEGNPKLIGEYHNQVFLATSPDGRVWRKRPPPFAPRPVLSAPVSNRDIGRQRYGLGQPSAYYRNGRFVLHCVDSCTGPGDFIVRRDSGDPYFRTGVPFTAQLEVPHGSVPEGAVARFAQTDVKPLGQRLLLVRPAYGTGRVGLLSSTTGVFQSDADASHPAEVYPQLDLPDPRGEDWLERLYPRFLTGPAGEVLVHNGQITIFYSSGRGWKSDANTWDIYRCDVRIEEALGSS